MALVVEHLKRTVLPAGHVVFEDNAPGDTLYIIESGRVQVSKTLEQWPRTRVRRDRTGGVFW